MALKSTFVQVAKNARKSPGLGVRKPELRAQTRQFLRLSLNFLICKMGMILCLSQDDAVGLSANWMLHLSPLYKRKLLVIVILTERLGLVAEPALLAAHSEHRYRHHRSTIT